MKGCNVPTCQPVNLLTRIYGYDAFYQTSLDYALRSAGRDQLIVTGVMTDVCVLATVTSALHHEHRATIVSDSVATLWEETQSVCLDLVRRCDGRVCSTEEVLAEI